MHSIAPPKLTKPFAPWPHYQQDEIDAVRRVLESGHVNQWTGNEIREFEREYADAIGRRHAVALMNGTVALELALKVLGVGADDEVIVTPRSFIASASVAVIRGALPVFADVDRNSGNVTAATIERAVTARTKAIIVVHLGGWPAEMASIVEMAHALGVAVIEDCAQAHGAESAEQPVGSFGDAAAFSFCQDKIITTGGEGGLLALDDESDFKDAWSFKDHGKGYDTVFHQEHPPGFQWQHDDFGTNWRMTEMQAAIGRAQLARLDQTVAQRTRNAELWRTHFDALPALRTPRPDPADRHAYYRLYTYVHPDALAAGWSRDRIREEIRDAGIPVTAGSCGEMYQEKAFKVHELVPRDRLPVAQELGNTSLAFLVHPTLSQDSIHEAGEIVSDIVRRATR